MRGEADGFPDLRRIRTGSKRSYCCGRVDCLHESGRSARQEVGVAIVFRRDRLRTRVKRRRLGIESGDTAEQVGVAKRSAAVKESDVAGRRAVVAWRHRSGESDNLTVRRWIGVGADCRRRSCLIDALRDGSRSARGEIGVAAILGGYGVRTERKIGKSQLRRLARQADGTERIAAIREGDIAARCPAVDWLDRGRESHNLPIGRGIRV